MTNSKATKKALISSVLALLLCFAMLLGTTFAWFTDEATSSGNIIQSGKLDVNMYWAKGDLDPEAADTQWTEAKSGPIFNNDKWEPGYVEAKHIKIANEGTLALKYQMRILANGVVSELADVIDVYYFSVVDGEEDLTGAVQLSRVSFTEANKLGTLSEVLNVAFSNNISTKISGNLEAGTARTLTLAFKMQETAGNEYQDLSIGADFSIQILATQLTSEKDSFDTDYDAGADFAPQTTPQAMVYALSKNEITNLGYTLGIGGTSATGDLDVGYSFQPTETEEQGAASEAANWHADFYVYADATVPANSLVLAGYYDAWCKYNNDCWVALISPDDIPANSPIRLIADGMNNGSTNSGITVPYSAICEYGNDGIGFLCGARDIDGANEGTTITVELRLYKTYPKGECGLEGHENCNSANCETGESITIGKFDYTFGGEYTTLADGSEVFMADDGDIILCDTANVTATEYYVPDGVTEIGNYAFKNSTIKNVVVSDSVTDLGRAFDESNVETVKLNEGLETISPRAFKSTLNLKKVEFSSTVTTIEDNAFQKTGITEITIPATVETIGETAFGASLVEKVIIEGNTSIQGYAFRGCTKLSTVYLNGDDVTFIPSTLNGRNSTWFCNGESNNPNTSDITFYVKNATVASRVYAAMGAEASNTTVIIESQGGNASDIPYVKDNGTLSSEITNGANTVVLSAGNYTVPTSAVAGKDITIVGAGDSTVFNFTTNYGVGNANITFENLKITGVNSNTMNGYGIQGTTGEVVYKNCTFENAMTSEFYGNVSYIDCTFVGTYYIATYAVDSATFEGCTFDRTDSRALLVYSHGDNPVNVTVKNCTFTADEKGYTSAPEWTAAIEVDTTNIPTAGTTVTIENCTYDENYNGIVRDKSTAGKETSVITVDGVVIDNTTIKTTGYSLNS